MSTRGASTRQRWPRIPAAGFRCASQWCRREVGSRTLAFGSWGFHPCGCRGERTDPLMQKDSNPGRHRSRRFQAAVAAFFLATSLTVAAGAAVAGAAESGSRLVQGQERLAPGRERTAQGRERISLSEAIRLVEQRSGGQVLRAETRRAQDRTVHRIRVITEDGRVRTWEVDAESGRIR